MVSDGQQQQLSTNHAAPRDVIYMDVNSKYQNAMDKSKFLQSSRQRAGGGKAFIQKAISDDRYRLVQVFTIHARR